MVSKTQSFGFGFVTWEKLRLRNLTNKKNITFGFVGSKLEKLSIFHFKSMFNQGLKGIKMGSTWASASASCCEKALASASASASCFQKVKASASASAS